MKCYVVDAFTKEVFKGNPAAVCVMDSWPSDEMMQNIAMENNLSETAFTVKEKSISAVMRRWGRPLSWQILSNHSVRPLSFIH